MITGELKHKIDSLWEMFWTGGLTNPLDVVEQMTYLMFIRDLDDTDRLRAREAAMLGLPHESIFAGTVKIGEREVEGDLLRWSKFQDIGAEQMYETVQTLVFPFIKGLHGNKESAYSKYMDDAIFKLPTPLLLSKVVDGLNEIYRLMAQNPGSDMRGDTYEYLLSKIAQSGVNGQFRTPRHIIRMMVELMAPQPTDTICDPACGTSGFLVAAGEYLKTNCREAIFFDQQAKEHYMTKMFTGYDMDRTMLRIGAMNMMTHGVENPVIAYRDSLSDQNPDRDASIPSSWPTRPLRAAWMRTSSPPTCSRSVRPKRPSCSSWPSFSACSAPAGAAPASCRTACSSGPPRPTKPSARRWWKRTAWKPSSPCPPASSSPTPGCPPASSFSPRPGTAAPTKFGSTT